MRSPQQLPDRLDDQRGLIRLVQEDRAFDLGGGTDRVAGGIDHRQRGARDARRVLRNAAQGHSLVFFPEGTFTRTPGLLKFHTGAFVSATRANCPLVPAVLRGTRRALPPSGALPRPGPIQLELLPPLLPRDIGQHAVPELRDRARAAILAALGEPDLTCCDDTDRPPDTAPLRSARACRP